MAGALVKPEVSTQVGEAQDISAKNEFNSSGEKIISREDGDGLIRSKPANSLHNLAT